MVPHDGHLVHKPSGISRFLVRALVETCLGLTENVEGVFWIGGGVNAGSICTTPPMVFLMNVVVSTVSNNSQFRARVQPSKRKLLPLRHRARHGRNHLSWRRL